MHTKIALYPLRFPDMDSFNSFLSAVRSSSKVVSNGLRFENRSGLANAHPDKEPLSKHIKIG